MENPQKVIHRLEISDNVFWLLLWFTFVAALVAFCHIICAHDVAAIKAAFAAGYEEAILPGSQSSHWVKVK